MIKIYFMDESKYVYGDMIEKIEAEKQSKDLNRYDPVYFVVPKQGKMVAEDMIMEASGHGTADVITDFSGLLNILIEDERKSGTDRINQYGIYMLIYKIIKDAADKLDIYNEESNLTANIPKIYEMLYEFKKNNTGFAELLNYSKEFEDREPVLSRKLKDLAYIYNEYERLTEDRFCDDEDIKREFAAGNLSIKPNEDKLNMIWIFGYSVLETLDIAVAVRLSLSGFNVNLILYGKESAEENDTELFAPVKRTVDMIERFYKNGFQACTSSAVFRQNIGTGTKKDFTRNTVEEEIKTEFIGNNAEKEIEKEFIGKCRSDASEEIKHMEKNLFSYAPNVYREKTERIELFSCADFRGEALNICEKILEFVRDEGMKLSDIAVVCSEHEDYHRILQMYLDRYELGNFIDKNRTALHNPIVEYISAVLDVAVEGSRQRDVIRVLKTGLTEIEAREWERLEIYSMQYKINGKKWYEPFSLGRSVYDEETFLEIEESRRKITELLATFKNNFHDDKTVGGKVNILYNFLKDHAKIHTESKELATAFDESGRYEEAQEMRQIWEIVISVMEQLEIIIGSEEISDGDFRDLLIEGFKHIKIGIVPPAKDQVIIGNPERVKLTPKKVIFMPGMNASVFPKEPEDSGIISNSDREKLVNIGAEQVWNVSKGFSEYSNLAFYGIFTKAKEHLVFSYSRGDSQGKTLVPSPIIGSLKRCFPNLNFLELGGNFISEKNKISGYRSMEEGLIKSLTEHMRGSEISQFWIKIFRWFLENRQDTVEKIEKGLLREKESRLSGKGITDSLFAFYDKDDDINDIALYNILTEELEAEMNKLLAEDVDCDGDGRFVISPTGLECFAGCPFKYFVQYGLRPKDRREYRVYEYNIGDIYHETFKIVLNELTPKLLMYKEKKNEAALGATGELTYKKLAKRVYAVMSEISKDYGEGVMYSNEESRYRLKAMKRICTANLWSLIEHAKAGNIKEMFHEISFGYGKDLSPLRIETPEKNEVFIEGKIDRVDILPGEFIKIVDYKSGARTFSMKEALSGWKLQLMIYLLAVMEDKNHGNKYIEAKPAGVFYYNVSATPLMRVKHVSKYGIRAVKKVNMTFFKETLLNGVVSKENEVIDNIDYTEQAEEGEKSQKFKVLPLRRKVNGELTDSRRNMLKSDDEMRKAVEDFRILLENLCGELRNGEVMARPMIKGNNKVCDYCEYRGICSFDNSFDECTYNVVE